MLLTFASAVIYLGVKDFALKNLPLGILREIWKEWELRFVTVSSLLLQFFLVGSGRIRSKYMGPNMLGVAIFAFMSYQLANYSATVVLSTLMRGPVGVNNSLAALWTPFFLWHLGSPYNITAFSLEDNDLWRRHLLGAFIHFLQALYICLRFGTDSKLRFIAIPVFVAGIVKYGEKIWALRSASTSHLVSYISSSHKIMEFEELNERGKRRRLDTETVNRYLASGDVSGEVIFLRRAYLYFSLFKRLYSDLPLYAVRRAPAADVIDTKTETADEAFRIVEMELGFLYDVLFTKIPTQLQKWGLVRYAFGFISMVCSVIGFTVLVVRRRYFLIRNGERLEHDLGRHPITDILITYMLFTGAIFLDVLTAVVHSRSNWAVAKRTSRTRRAYYWLVGPRLRLIKSRVGVRMMAQLDLFNYCCGRLAMRRSNWLVQILDTENLLGMSRYTKWREVDPDLKKLIFDYLQNKHDLSNERYFDFESLVSKEANALSPSRPPELNISSFIEEGKDFVRCVFVFHIATSLVYYDDHIKYPRGVLGKACEIGKSLSDYMSYLAMVRPLMFPKGINEEIRIDTDKQVRRLYDPQKQASDDLKIMTKLVTRVLMCLGEGISQVGLPSQPEEVRNESALMEGIFLATTFQYLVTKERWDQEQKWELISNLWLRMMVYAAELCPWKEHAKQLPNGGGELLTHVALLLAHLHLKP